MAHWHLLVPRRFRWVEPWSTRPGPVAQTSKSAVSRASQPAGRTANPVLGVKPCICTIPTASDCASMAYKPQTTHIGAGKTRNGTLAFVGSSTFSVGGTVLHAAGACSADFPVCCIAGFPARWPHRKSCAADLEIGDTAGLETCATGRRITLETSRKPHLQLFKA